MTTKLLFISILCTFGFNLHSQNLVTNGDFESGGNGVGFSLNGAGYNLITGPFSGTTASGDYAFTANPQPMNTANFIASGDHTTGTGKMMAIDGNSTGGSQRFWRLGNTGGGACALTVNANYQFSYWIRSISNTVVGATTQADIGRQFSNASNITLVSGSVLAPLPAAGWQQVIYTFKATAACVNIELWNNNVNPVGNDFAVDDFALVQLPTAVISGSTTVCQNAGSPVITFTGADGIAPYTFTYNINGGSNLTVTTTIGNSVNVAVPTGTGITYNYNLLGVSYGIAPVYSQAQTGTATVIITPTPATATMALSSGTACFNGTATTITFTGSGGTAPYTFIYSTSFTGPQTITTVSGNSITIPVITSTAGPINYFLTQVSSPANSCPTIMFSSIAFVVRPELKVKVNDALNCIHDNLVAKITATPEFPGTYNYVWVVPAIFPNPGNVATFNTTVAGNYQVVMTDVSTGCSSSPTAGKVEFINCFVDVNINTPLPVCDIGDCTNLHAEYPKPHQTTDYLVSQINYNPSFPFIGGTLIAATADDVWSPYVNLPFNVCFYGVNYNRVLVGTNGVVTFDPGQPAGGFCFWAYGAATIPSPAFPIRNAIYGVYQDTNIQSPPVTNPAIQNVNYYVLSTGVNAYPNRVFVANFNELPQYQCNAGVGFQTSQVVIHETTGIIEILVSKRTSCTSWNQGSGLIGLQNQAGTLASVPPGRNTGTWSTTNEAWRFMPYGKQLPTTNPLLVPTTIAWTLPPSTAVLSTADNFNVCPTGPQTYLATVTYQTCSGPMVVTETVNVDVAPPLPVLSPVNRTFCGSVPYTANIDQTTYILNGSSLSDYNIKYYENIIDAQNDASNNITNLSAFIVTSTPKTIYVRIEDLNITGCSNVRSFIINIIPTPGGTFIYPNTPYCHSIATAQPITPTTLTSGGTFTSSPIGLTLDPNTGGIIPLTSLVGTYTVSYNVPLTPYCPAYQTQTTVDIVNCGCSVTASNTGPICAGGTFDLAATTVAGATYAWTGPGFSSTSQNPLSVPAPTGTAPYIYQVIVTSPGGICNNTTTVVVNPLPTVTVNSPAVCAGTNATVTATPGTAGTYSYLWTVPGAFSNPGNVASFTTAVSGTYSVIITNTASLCTSASASGIVTINPLPTVTVNNPAVCAGASATVTATPGTIGTYSYAWTVPVPASAPGNVSNFSTNVSGTYTVVITNTTTLCVSAPATGTLTINPLPTVSVNSPTVCAGAIATVTATAGTAGTYTYVWMVPAGATPPGNVGSFSTTFPGSIDCVITDTTTLCTSATASGVVTINTLPTVTVNSPTVCTGALATVTATPGTVGTYSYAWTVPATAGLPGNVASFTTAVAGTYSVIITNTSTLCASVSSSGTVTVNLLPTVTVNSPIVCAGSPATLLLVCGGSGFYIYNWTVPPGAAFPGNVATFTTTVNGPYGIDVKDTVTGCVSATSIGTVTVNPLPTVTVNSPTVCTGASATVAATPGTPGSYSYAWTVPAFAAVPGNFATFTTTVSGTYSVVITDTSTGCVSAVAAGVVTIGGLPTVSVTCPKICSGSTAPVTAVPGTASLYSYAWTVPSGAVAPGNVATFNTSTAGVYSVIITDVASGCVSLSASATLIIDPLPTLTVNSPVVCAGSNATVRAVPDIAGTYTYSWTVPTGAAQPGNVAIFSTTTAGTYTLVITNTGSTCISLPVSTLVTINPEPTVTVNNISLCAGAGNTITATPGTAGTYSYAWTIPTGATAPGSVPSFITMTAGVYSVIITDNSSTCISRSASGTATVNPLPTVTVNSPTTCVGTAVNISATAGTAGTYSYSWTVPAGVPLPGNVSGFLTAVAGTYTVIITDTVTGCISLPASGTLIVNPLPTVTVNSPRVCFGASATVIASAGTAGTYSYSWTVPTSASAPGNVASFTTTTAGTYGVTITNTSTNCVSTIATGIVTIDPLPTVSINSPTVCNGAAATITAVPGIAGSYSYAWTVPSGAAAQGNVANFSTTFAGTYSVIITNTATNCVSANASGVVTLSPLPTVTVNSPTTCAGVAVNILATSGSAGTYNYAWTVPVGAAVPGNVSNFNTAFPGTYSVVIINTVTNCVSAAASGTLTVNPLPIVSVNSPSTCAGIATTVTATPTTVGTYSYAWTVPSSVSPPGNVASFITTIGGTYSVIITNTATNCTSLSASGIVRVNPLPTVAVANVSTCAGTLAQMTASPGTPGAYSYAWTVPATAAAPGNAASFLTGIAGTYSVIITTISTGCVSTSASGILTVNALPTVAVNSPTTCAGISTTVTATPGTAGSYSYIWTVPTGALLPGNVASFTTTTAGTYSVIIRNTTTNCSSTSASGTVTVNALPTVVVNNPTTCAGIGTTVIATPGSSGSYSYTWTVPAGATAPGNVASFTTTIPGNYSVIIRNTVTNCVGASATGTVTASPLPVVLVNSPVICQGQTATVNATPLSSATYSYSWTVPTGATPPGNTASFGTTTAGTYTVIITNTTTGCVSLPVSGTVNVNPLPTVTVSNATICDGASATVTATPATAGTYSYSWVVPAGATQPGNVAGFLATVDGVYSVTITNVATTCTSLSASGTVTVIALPTVVVNSPTICSGTSTVVIATPGTPGTYSYAWTVPTGVPSPGNVASFTTTVAGIYSVIITNVTTSCSSASAIGIVSASFPPMAGSASASSYFSEHQIITVAVSPAGIYEYQMDNGPFQSSNQFINFASGWHTIIVRNECGILAPILIRIIDYPHFFTPNGDGYNDTWNIHDLSDQTNSVIYIYDRYGKLLKQIAPSGAGWDGTFNGKQLPSTDYWFKVFFREMDTDQVFKAHFSLKR